MVRAWYMDSEENDQRLEHHRNPPQFISVDDLFKKTGVEHFQVRLDCISAFLEFVLIVFFSALYFAAQRRYLHDRWKTRCDSQGKRLLV